MVEAAVEKMRACQQAVGPSQLTGEVGRSEEGAMTGVKVACVRRWDAAVESLDGGITRRQATTVRTEPEGVADMTEMGVDAARSLTGTIAGPRWIAPAVIVGESLWISEGKES
jgi:hypothetical protein